MSIVKPTFSEIRHAYDQARIAHWESEKPGRFKLGLDYHGVLDTAPEFFRELSFLTISAGGEVHILTGCMDTPQLREEIEKLQVPFTKLFSIPTYHLSIGTKVWEDDRGPWMDEETWCRTKGEYCKREGIVIHIDDSPRYGQYFTSTTYVQVQL